MEKSNNNLQDGGKCGICSKDGHNKRTCDLKNPKIDDILKFGPRTRDEDLKKLSNYYESQITIDGIEYNSGAQAYHYLKYDLPQIYLLKLFHKEVF